MNIKLKLILFLQLRSKNGISGYLRLEKKAVGKPQNLNMHLLFLTPFVYLYEYTI